MWETFLYVIFFIAAALLILVILLQEGKGGGLSDAFGGAGHIRFSYAASDDDLVEAMDLVEETLNEI